MYVTSKDWNLAIRIISLFLVLLAFEVQLWGSKTLLQCRFDLEVQIERFDYFEKSKFFTSIFYNWFRDDSARSTTSEDEGVYSLKPPINGNYGRFSSGPPSIISAPEVLQNVTSNNPNYFEEDLTPKHYIRSPIIEETESNVEAELRSRQRSRQQQRWNKKKKQILKLDFRKQTKTILDNL